MFVVVNFDALTRASSFRIERRRAECRIRSWEVWDTKSPAVCRRVDVYACYLRHWVKTIYWMTSLTQTDTGLWTVSEEIVIIATAISKWTYLMNHAIKYVLFLTSQFLMQWNFYTLYKQIFISIIIVISFFTSGCYLCPIWLAALSNIKHWSFMWLNARHVTFIDIILHTFRLRFLRST